MAQGTELIRAQGNGTICFGDYTRTEKGKKSDFEFQGDLYKVKTFAEITKLERNGLFVYESVPGSTVTGFQATEDGVSFQVEAPSDVQIILGLEESAQYQVEIDGADTGVMETNMGGKLVLGIETTAGRVVPVKVVKR